MVHELLVRLLGLGMAGLLQFQPPVLTYAGDTLQVETVLRQPMTGEIQEAVRGGYAFTVEYSYSIIINDRKSYQGAWTNRLSHDGAWKVNGSPVPQDSAAARMGRARARFARLRFHPGDELLVYVKASIPGDTLFTRSTGLHSAILWNYHIPISKSHWGFGPEGFRPL